MGSLTDEYLQDDSGGLGRRLGQFPWGAFEGETGARPSNGTRWVRLQQELGDTGQFAHSLSNDDVNDPPKQMSRKRPDSPL